MQTATLMVSAALLAAVNSLINGFGNKTAVYGSQAYYSCDVNNLPGVLQITWQRMLKDEIIENLATYSKRFGQQVNEPYRGKIALTEASLNSTAITVKNVTWGDESCYICSFNVYPDGSRRRQTCLTVTGISEVSTAVHVSAEAKENGGEVTFTCSATGKPPPTIQWNLPSPGPHDRQPQTTTVTNSDSTFTSSRNISLQAPSGWKGHVDCVVNSGMTGERRERIPVSLDPGKKKEEKGTTTAASHVVAVVVVCILCLIFVAVAFIWKRQKSVTRHEVIL